jgi:hypothetical protein
VLPSEDAVIVDLRLTRSGGPSAETLDDARDAFARWIANAAAEPQTPHVFIAPAIDAPARDVLGEGILAPDIIVAHPCSNGRWELEIGEVKVYPDRGGHTDTNDLAATRSQAGLYLLALEGALAMWGVSDVTARERGFLVLSWAGSNTPSVRSGESLAFRARAAARGIERLRQAAAALSPVTAGAKDRAKGLAVIAAAATEYREACVSFCPRAGLCHRRACDAQAPTSLGDAAETALRGVDLSRAFALASGDPPANDREAVIVEQLAPLRALLA